MADYTDDILRSLPRPAREARPRQILYWGMAILGVSVGVIGSLPDSRLTPMLPPKIYLQPLFGALLSCLVVMQFIWTLRNNPASREHRMRTLTRQLSRVVYLELYTVLGARQIIALTGNAPPGATFGHGGYTDCQAILVYGLIALVVIRLLAYRNAKR